MSTLAKIFIVLNLLIAMAFTVASLTLYAKRLHWVDYARDGVIENNQMYIRHKHQSETYEKQIAALNERVATQTTQIHGLERTNETQMIANEQLSNHLARQEGELTNINNQIVILQAEVKRKEERNAKLQEILDQTIQVRNEFRTRMEFAEQRVIEALADLKQSETELMNVAKQNAELVRRIALLTNRVDAYVRVHGPLDEMRVPPAVPVRGRVLRVEPEIQLVILDVGEKDEVKRGMEFLISRGDQLVGKVQVQNVLEDMCSARILPGFSGRAGEIQVADIANTPSM